MATKPKAKPETQTPKPDPLPRVGLVENSLHQKWIEVKPAEGPQQPVTLQQPTPPPDNFVSVIEEMPGFEEDEPENTYDELMSELTSQGETLTCHVTSFPNYHNDHNASTAHAETEVAGSFIIPPTVRNRDDLIRHAQEKYATPDKPFHHFMLTVRGRRIKRNLPIVRVKSVGYAERPTTPQGEGNHVISAAVDPFAEMEKALKLVERFHKLTPKGEHAPTRAEAEEMTTEAALLKVAMTDKKLIEEIASGISAKIFPNAKGDDGIPGWMQGLIQLLAPVVPALLQKLTASPEPTTPDHAQRPAITGAVEMQNNGAGAAPSVPPEIHTMREIMARIVYGIRNGFQPDFIAEEIDMLCEKNTALDQICTEFFAQPIANLQATIAQNVPSSAPVVMKPDAAQWITEMLQYWAPEPQIEGQQ